MEFSKDSNITRIEEISSKKSLAKNIKFKDIVELSLSFANDLSKEDCSDSTGIDLVTFKPFFVSLSQNFLELYVPPKLIDRLKKQIGYKWGTGRNKFRIEVFFITDENIANLNLKYYKKTKTPTDILTFPYNTLELWGEIFISICSGLKKAVLKGEERLAYLRRLFIHGILHLFFGPHSDEFDEVEDLLLTELIT